MKEGYFEETKPWLYVIITDWETINEKHKQTSREKKSAADKKYEAEKVQEIRIELLLTFNINRNNFFLVLLFVEISINDFFN